MIDVGTEMKANGRRIGTIQKHFQKNRSAKSQTEIIIYFHEVTPGVPASPASASTSYISATPEIENQPLFFLSLFSMKTKMKTFMMISFHLMNVESSH